MPSPVPVVAAVPESTPFVGPEELARTGRHATLLRLGANESAFGPSPRAVKAMAAELPRLSWYGDPESYELRVALARRHGCSIENITIGSGIDDLLGLLVRAYAGAGGRALTTRGTYPTFEYHVLGYGGTLESVPYAAHGSIDCGALLEAARRLEPGVLYFVNPDNPSGTIQTPQAVAALLRALPGRTLLVLDEAYADFLDPQDLLPATDDERLVRLRTFSKAHGMAGARIGYAIAPATVCRTLQKIRLQYGVNRNAQIGALASLDDASFTATVLAEVARGREEYYALAESCGLGFLRSQTNFVCIDAGSRAAAEALVAELLARGVFIRKPGAPPLDRYVRVTVGTATERELFVRRFAEALAATRPVRAAR